MNIAKQLALGLSALTLGSIAATAQRHEILDPNIRSLQVIADNDWRRMPIIGLRGGQLSVSFDDLTHEYHRYAYRLTHCEADWKPSEALFESDYCDGFASGNTIDDVQESILTNTLYTHYRLTLPNGQCAMKRSGNYLLTIYDENDDDREVARIAFMVTEPAEAQMGVGLKVLTNTDATINQHHQQVEMEVGYGGYRVTDPQRQLTTVVLQNQRWDDARWNARPQYTMADGLRWSHCGDYLFWAGNEYRKFEILSTDVAAMGVDRIDWDGTQYHAYLDGRATTQLHIRPRRRRRLRDPQFRQLPCQYGERLPAGTLPLPLRKALSGGSLSERQLHAGPLPATVQDGISCRDTEL